MIDEKKLIEDLLEQIPLAENVQIFKEIIESQPKVGEWIPCEVEMPKEHDTMFAKFKGTETWNDAMFEKISDDVNVTIEYSNGARKTDTMHTTDGKWKFHCTLQQKRVVAWMPLPEPYKE